MSPLDLRDDDAATGDDEAIVARLLAAAGPPPPAPELEVARIQEAARAEWRRRYVGRAAPTARRRWAIAAAAALALAAAWLIAGRLGERGEPAPLHLATVERAVGATADGAPLAGGARLGAGAVVRTGPAAPAALALAGGRSLRLDASSELRLASARRLELVRGAVYLDSAGAPAASAPELVTPAGRFREVGTRFELRLLAGREVRLRVREGEVRHDSGASADAGEELRVMPGRPGERRRIASHGTEWAWVLAAAPTPAIEGWSLARYLEWHSRESGLRLAYASERDARLAAEVVLHGSIAHLAAGESLAVVLASAGFEHRIEDGVVRVAARGGLRTPS